MENYQLAGRIRAYRKLKGYTQQQLARKMGISLAVLGAVERGARKPDAGMLEDICRTLGIELQELLEA